MLVAAATGCPDLDQMVAGSADNGFRVMPRQIGVVPYSRGDPGAR
jgi:hypothetical protein